MTATVVLDRASRARWLARRRKGIGASDVAVILGYSQYRTPFDLWLDKTGRSNEFADSYPMARGRHMEPFLLEEYGRRTGAWIERPPMLLAHPDHPELLASLDGLAHHPDRTVVTEAKTAGWRSREAWWDEERMAPDAYCVQALYQLAVTGIDEAVLVADVAGEFTTVTIMRDEAWEAVCLPMLAQWWADHVVADEPPAPDYERDTIAALNRAWVPVPGTAVEATPATAGALVAARKLQAKVTERKALIEALRVQVRAGMGTAQTLTIDGHKAAYLDARGTLLIANQKEHTA